MINPNQWVGLILEPALKAVDMYSLDAMYLMTATALMESKLTHLKQLPEGPALGLFQVEWATYLDCLRYIANHQNLYDKITTYLEREHLPGKPVNLIGDLSLNAIIARVKYYMIPETIPSYKNPEAQAQYYKQYYNTSMGAANVDSFVKALQDIQGWISHDEGTS